MRGSLKAKRHPKLHAVVLAGGAGQRFWPRSRKRHPKPLLQVLGGKTLLEQTLVRARRCAGRDRVWLVCTQHHASEMRRVSGLPARRVLVEPRGRNTAMAVALAAQHIAAEDPDAVLAVLPADHVIPDVAEFASAIARAAHAADTAEVLVTLGVKPTWADPGYGYIASGKPVGRRHPGLRRVRRFVEKPSPARARGYLKRGGYFWNAGIFVWRASTILEEIQECAPTLHRALEPLRRKPRGRGFAAARDAAYRKAPSLPVDVAVMERSRRVWTLPVKFHWSDVGNWASLARELGVNPRKSQVIGGEVMLQDAPGNLVWGNGKDRLVVLLGARGLAVIDTPDALLVADLERTPEVRAVVERLSGKRASASTLT